MFRGKLGLAVAVGATALVAVAPPASAEKYVAGSAGSGDPFFPQAGNGGYDVRHYSLTIDYDQPANVLSGKAVIGATATQNLRSFNLDLRDLYTVSKVRVNGEAATFAQHDGQELTINPRPKLERGKRFEVKVVYSGQPEPITDPDESIEGWVPTDDGAFVVNEPQGSPGWFPVNDTPRDKATYDFTISVPAGKEVIANGELVGHPVTAGGQTTWRWAESNPMAPYLATVTNGDFLTEFRSAGGLPFYDAVDPNTRRSDTDPPNPTLAFQRLDPEPEIVSFFSSLYGRIPVQQRGRDHRLGARRRLLTRVADPPELRPHPLGDDGRPRDLAPVVRRRGDAGHLAGHLAERGIRHLVGVDLRRDARRPPAQDRFDELYAIPEDDPAFEDLWFPRAGRTPGSEPALPHAGLRPRGDDPAGAAGEGG